jgi:tRNA(Arg) A34 adenosine deaminase TadA
MKYITLLALLFIVISCNSKIKEPDSKTIETVKEMNQDKSFISETIEIAKSSKTKGNLPYGCILVNKEGEVILKGENTINTDHDMLAHAEINLLREASKIYVHEYLQSCTIYTSHEPCPMCASAIYWTGVGKLVYGLSKPKYYNIVGRENPNWVFEMSAKEVLSKGGRKVEIVGPLLENEVATLHNN